MMLTLAVGCGGGSEEYPLNLREKGMAALRWSMAPEAAMTHMLEMDSVVLMRDTSFSFPGGYLPSYEKPDSVRIGTKPEPARSYRYVQFRGGSFLGNPVAGWNLRFERGTELAAVQISLAPDERNKRRASVLESRFRDRYDPAGPEKGKGFFNARGVSGSADTTQPVDTQVSLYESGKKTLTIGYESKAVIDSTRQWYADLGSVRMSVREYEAYAKKHGGEPLEETGRPRP